MLVEHENEMKKLKIFNVAETKEKKLLHFFESESLLSECNLPFIYRSNIFQMSNLLIYERSYYSCDLKCLISTNYLSFSEISSIMVNLSNILMILCECGIEVSNLKSSNIIHENENNEMKLSDLCLNELRREEEMRIDDVCYMSVRELLCLESDIKENYIWKLGSILYEILSHELPFYSKDSKKETIQNILKCEYNRDLIKDDEMKEILNKMLKVVNEDGLNLIEFNKEMTKENEMMKDLENNIMINEERKEMLYKYDINILALMLLKFNNCNYNGRYNYKGIIIIFIIYMNRNSRCFDRILQHLP